MRIDSTGHQHDVLAACDALGASFTVTALQRTDVRAAVVALATDPATTWQPALNTEGDKGSEIAATSLEIGRHREQRRLRSIVRRQPTSAGDQLSLDDLDGWRFHAIVTNIAAETPPAEIEAHHRPRGGIPEDTIRGSSMARTRRCSSMVGA